MLFLTKNKFIQFTIFLVCEKTYLFRGEIFSYIIFKMEQLITNEFQKSVYKEFAIRMADLNLHEFTLARFLVAREFNLDKAEDMLRKNLQWRKENDIDKIISEFPEDSEAAKLFPIEITGLDHNGGAVGVVPWKYWDARNWINCGRTDELFRWSICTMEIILNLVMNPSAPKGIQKLSLIYDLADLSYGQASDIRSLKLLFKVYSILEQSYPETLNSITIINAPWMFHIPYNFVKCIFSNRTAAKIKVFNSDRSIWLKHLLEIAPKESLPQRYFNDTTDSLVQNK